ncbi:MBL fold metallo-hydrolase [Aestuariibacter halophilus]|uniref:MBL fold metallo-hydrolase n=1 Tax=Fluctibacter halophilus TaxID=226011 RepID=A0ABS8GA74_9ALTE|nr:MBL fold metallo-hydrolase [Aestuariibacter halophilus]MCC2616126.1 MBL fold metallo-hydrolase [Aestuariibacter halophilus]
MSALQALPSFVLALFFVALAACSTKPLEHITQSNLAPSPTSALHGRFFGTTTLLISDGETHIMVDGFFTRHSKWHTVINGIQSDRWHIAQGLLKGKVTTLDWLLISHAHFDHALDADNTATMTNATVIGSQQSLQHITRAPTRQMQPHFPLHDSKFDIYSFDSGHIQKKPFSQWIENTYVWAARGSAFADPGTVYSFLLTHPQGNLLIVPSARFPDTIKLPVAADTVFLGIGLVGKLEDSDIEELWQHAVVNTCARQVIPIHWDDFTHPIAPNIPPTQPPFDDLAHTFKILQQLSERDGIPIIFPPAYRPFAVIPETKPFSSSDNVCLQVQRQDKMTNAET